MPHSPVGSVFRAGRVGVGVNSSRETLGPNSFSSSLDINRGWQGTYARSKE
jgi:hypothetical protein